MGRKVLVSGAGIVGATFASPAAANKPLISSSAPTASTRASGASHSERNPISSGRWAFISPPFRYPASSSIQPGSSCTTSPARRWLYFDAVSRVVIACWSSGRVALVGDAAPCVSLFGGGTGLAIAGARILADELAATSNHAAALARYEARHRQAVTPRQRGMSLISTVMVPRSRLEIGLRNAAIRAVALFSRRKV